MRFVYRVLSDYRSTRAAPCVSKACLAITLLATAALGFGGCAQSPQQLAAGPHSKEYFPSSVYGPASRRVIADGQPVPHGGGQYLVGKPYTIAGQTYYPSERKITQVGLASWYGDAFHGRLTANGEIYDRSGFTAAHPTMPLPSYARVTNLRNGYSMVVRVNDRGPYHSNRVMDVSSRVAEALDFKRYGTSKVKIEYVGRASLAGSEDAKLYATLRTNGPAPTGGLDETTMVADNTPSPARVASLAPYAPQSRVPSRLADETAQRSEVEKAHGVGRKPVHVASREAMPSDDEAPAAGRGAQSRSSSRANREIYAMHETRGGEAQASRHDHFGSSRIADRNGEPKHAMSMASRDSGGQARASAMREVMPTARPGRAGGNAKHADARKTMGRLGGVSSGPVLPPSRPQHLAALSTAAKHHPEGLRLTRTRDD